MRAYFLLACLGLIASSALAGPSVITTRLDDPKAVYLAAPAFPVHTDGTTDDSAALQAAIDKADVNHEGIVFVPSGRYAIAHTVYVRAGIRLFGYGATRPVFLLPPRSPGFDQGMGVMFMFIGASPGGAYDRGARVPVPPPGTVPPKEVPDANSGTFYSSMSNIDFEIGEGNSRAVAIRFHVAQHAFLTHMDFHLGSALAGIYQVGNEAEDLHFYGGRYGILAEKTSPAWQFTLLDSSFEGQSDAAIREHEAGLTLVRDTFRNVPTAIDIDPEYYDQLWSKDCRFDHVSRAAVIISNEKSRLNEIGFEGALLSDVPTFALFRESGRKLAGKGSVYRIADFNFGIIVPALGRMGEIGTRYQAESLSALPAALPPAIRPLPPSTDWVNVKTLGVIADGKTDDTAALQKAIDTHPVLYLPGGHYLVSETLTLKPETVLIGLHPTLSQINLADDSPAFRDVGAPRPVLLAPSGGNTVLSGFGLSTGGVNPRAVGVLWRAGEHSLIDDVRFLGGHGSGTNPYNNNQTSDPDARRRWDGQYPSLWVTGGGGGTFADIWTPDTFAQSGLYVSDTKTPGHVYELSAEHHVRNEIKLERVENWEFFAPQTEEEAGESPESLSLEISQCRNITIANYHAYRVTRSRAPFPAAVRLYNSSDIRFRNIHVNAESGYAFCDANGCGTYLRVSKYPYENAIQDITHKLEVRDREFAVLDVPSTAPAPPAASPVKKVETGFFSIAGAAVDSAGKLYFVDRHAQRIYGWTAREGLSVERDSPLDPANLAFDGAGNLLVQSSFGPSATVYSFRPGSSMEALTALPAHDAAPPAGARILLPVNFWNNGEFRDQLNLDTLTYKTLAEMFREDVTTPRTKFYVSPDGTAVLPAARVVQQGPPDSRGWRFSDNLDTHGFLSAAPGEHVYVSNGSDDRTYNASVNANGTLADLKPFADRGGECVAVDRQGNVYVANGQIFVYNRAGKQIQQIDVPERPLDLVFGGPDHRTLFILAHHSLYSLETR